MGTEAIWVPLALAAVSSGAEAYNQSSANQRQQDTETQGILQQQKLQQQAAGNVNNTIKAISNSNPTQTTQSSIGDFVNQLRKNQAASTNPSAEAAGGVPGASSRYAADTSSDNQSIQDYGSQLASQMGAINGAVRQRQNEGLAMGNLSTQNSLLGAQSGADSFITQLRAASAGQQNPWVGLGAGLVGNAAGASSKNPQWFSGKDQGGVDPDLGI